LTKKEKINEQKPEQKTRKQKTRKKKYFIKLINLLTYQNAKLCKAQ
jgi:hypothetical protein